MYATEVIPTKVQAHHRLKVLPLLTKSIRQLIRGLAHVGIAALVDEATGYQAVRDRLALQAILDKFLEKEFAAWAKKFPNEFYNEIFRLRIGNGRVLGDVDRHW